MKDPVRATSRTTRRPVARLVRAGELEVSGADQEEVDSYFDTEGFAFHGPDGSDSDYKGLTEYFRSIRAAGKVCLARNGYPACRQSGCGIRDRDEEQRRRQ